MFTARPGTVFASLAALLLILSGCTATSSDPPVAASAAPATPDDGTIATSEYFHLANSRSVEKFISSEGLASVPWVVINSAPGGADVFIAYVAGGNCGSHKGVDVIETAETVTIVAANVPLDSKSAAACKAEPVVEGGRIDLDAALGSRILMHAAVSPPWSQADHPIPTEQVTTNSSKRNTSAEAIPRLSYDGAATCSNLLSATTRARFAREGLTLADEGYTQVVADQPDLFPRRFLVTGGIVCAYGPKGGNDSTVLFGFSPIAPAVSEVQRQDALDDGGVLQEFGTYDLYLFTTEGSPYDPAALLFGDGYWAYAQDWGGGSVIDDLISNAPQYG